MSQSISQPLTRTRKKLPLWVGYSTVVHYGVFALPLKYLVLVTVGHSTLNYISHSSDKPVPAFL